MAATNSSKKKLLIQKYGKICFYCLTEFPKARSLTVDHFVPKSKIKAVPYNKVLCCKRCNSFKGNSMPVSVMIRLRRMTKRFEDIMDIYNRDGGLKI